MVREGSVMNDYVAPLGVGLSNVGTKVIDTDYNKHLDRYVFCLEDINLADRRLSVLNINRGRIARLEDISIADLDMSEEALTREGIAVHGTTDTQMTTVYTKTAADQALELYISYGERGLCILESLTGQGPQTVKAIEELLLDKIPTTLNDLQAEVAGKIFVQDRIGQIAVKTQREILDCIDKTSFYRHDIVAKAEGELAARDKHDGRGLSRVTSGMRFYAESLGHTLDVDKKNKAAEPFKIELPKYDTDPTQIAQIVAATVAALKQTEEKEKEPEVPTKTKK